MISTVTLNGMSSIQARVCIAAAFAVEARPLRQALKLKRLEASTMPFPVYASDHAVLVETGLGKLRAAAAIASTLTAFPSLRSVLNIGIAGGSLPVGSCCIAGTIVDHGSGRRWYPDLPPSRLLSDKVHCTTLETLDTPGTHYTDGTAFDMEAAGICAAAIPVVGTGGIQCVKVISDGPDQALDNLDKRMIGALMETHLQSFLAVIAYLGERREPARDHGSTVETAVQHCLDACARHSSSETHRLRKLISRYLAMGGELTDLPPTTNDTSAAELAYRIEQLIDACAVEYS